MDKAIELTEQNRPRQVIANLTQKPLSISKDIIESNQHEFPDIQKSELASSIDKLNADFNKMMQDMRDSIKLMKVQQKPLEFGRPFILRLTNVTVTAFPDVAQKIQTNNLDIDTYLMSLRIFFEDATSSQHAILKMTLGDAVILDENTVGDYTTFNDFSVIIPETSRKFQRSKDLKIFARTDAGASPLNLTFMGFVGCYENYV